MFKIVRFPKKLEAFFEPLRTKFLWNHFEYFRMLVLLVAIAHGRRNISALYRHLDARGRPHRTRFNNFLLVQRWAPEEALAETANRLLMALKPRPGDRVYLIIDHTEKEKRGGRKSAAPRDKSSKAMEAVDWIYDGMSGQKIRGHQFVCATIVYNQVQIPLGVRLYVKKELCPEVGVSFKKMTQLAAELIRGFQAPEGVEVIVLFDSYYLCPTVVKACRRKGFSFVAPLKSNRNLFKNGRKLKAGQYGNRRMRRRRDVRRMCLKRGERTRRYDFVDAGWLQVGDLGKLHVVFSRPRGDRKVTGFATEHTRLGAREILAAYSHRWSIEVAFKAGKQLLGLGQYQNGAYHAAVIHLHLVWFAFALLTHVAITCEGAQGKKTKRKSVATRSISQLQDELRRIVWEDTAEYLKSAQKVDAVLRELEILLCAA